MGRARCQRPPRRHRINVGLATRYARPAGFKQTCRRARARLRAAHMPMTREGRAEADVGARGQGRRRQGFACSVADWQRPAAAARAAGGRDRATCVVVGGVGVAGRVPLCWRAGSPVSHGTAPLRPASRPARSRPREWLWCMAVSEPP
jgi:hypothetical protein